MPWRRRRPRHDSAAHAHARETHLATQYPCCHQLSHTQTGDPSCRCRRLLDLHCQAQLHCSTAPAFIVHRYLIYHFLQNLIQYCLWISESKNLCWWTCDVSVFTDKWWTDVGDSMIVNLKIYSTCCFFFFFFFGLLALWLCVCGSLSYIIEKIDRERKRVEFVKIREYIEE